MKLLLNDIRFFKRVKAWFNHLLSYTYPHHIFVSHIRAYLLQLPICSQTKVVDAPSGSGMISYGIHHHFKLPFYLYDNNPDYIKRAQKLFYDVPSIHIECADIFQLDTTLANDVWLLINSIHCLPNVDRLIQRYYDRFQYIICVYGNIHSQNFKSFHQRNPDYPLHQLFTKESLIQLMTDCGYDAVFTEPIGNIHHHHYCFNRSILNQLLYRLYRLIHPLCQTGIPPYFLTVFKRY